MSSIRAVLPELMANHDTVHDAFYSQYSDLFHGNIIRATDYAAVSRQTAAMDAYAVRVSIASGSVLGAEELWFAALAVSKYAMTDIRDSLTEITVSELAYVVARDPLLLLTSTAHSLNAFRAIVDDDSALMWALIAVDVYPRRIVVNFKGLATLYSYDEVSPYLPFGTPAEIVEALRNGVDPELFRASTQSAVV